MISKWWFNGPRVIAKGENAKNWFVKRSQNSTGNANWPNGKCAWPELLMTSLKLQFHSRSRPPATSVSPSGYTRRQSRERESCSADTDRDVNRREEVGGWEITWSFWIKCRGWGWLHLWHLSLSFAVLLLYTHLVYSFPVCFCCCCLRGTFPPFTLAAVFANVAIS